MINIVVAYATPKNQIEIALEVEPNCNVAVAIRRSGVLERFPEIDLPNAKVGIFSRCVLLDAPLENFDRIEIYRPLTIDPKAARLLRAKKVNR